MFKTLILLLLFLGVNLFSHAMEKPRVNLFYPNFITPPNKTLIAAPSIHCIQTNAAGDVTLSWTPVNDPDGSFISYEIYSIQNGLQGTIVTIGTSSYTDPALGKSLDYYLVVNSNDGGPKKSYSDTLSNIYLDLSNPSNGTAILKWNVPKPVAKVGMGKYTHILREYPAGNWTVIDSVPYKTVNYIDTIDICQAFLNYRILLPNQPCDFSSNIQGDNFRDRTTPDMPVIQAVTIDSSNNNVTITWNKNQHADTYGYIIYQLDKNGFITTVDTVWGLNSINYTYSTDVNEGALTYSVAAFDSCYTSSGPPNYQISAKAAIHTSVFLTTKLSICTGVVALNWTNYVGWSSVSTYEILGHRLGEPWESYGTTTGTSYEVNVSGLTDYNFVVKAKSITGLNAFSNKSYLKMVSPTPPAFHYLSLATVQGKTVELHHFIDNTPGVSSVIFQRLNDANIFEEIGRLPVTSRNIFFVDETAEVDKQSYTYRAQVVDSCGNLGQFSNKVTTILIQWHPDDLNKRNYITWNAYVGFNGPVIAYRLHKTKLNTFSTTSYVVLGPDQLYFEDYDFDLNSSGKTCYSVEAVEGPNIYDTPKVSKSNEICPIFAPVIYVPNSFTPKGINPIFKPVVSYFAYESYKLTIYNRWGQYIFYSDVPEEGWNGTISTSNEVTESGTYMYHLYLRDGNGVEIVKRGSVTLIY
jgi:gliding motility-associated-like protein